MQGMSDKISRDWEVYQQLVSMLVFLEGLRLKGQIREENLDNIYWWMIMGQITTLLDPKHIKWDL